MLNFGMWKPFVGFEFVITKITISAKFIALFEYLQLQTYLLLLYFSKDYSLQVLNNIAIYCYPPLVETTH